MSQRTKIRWPAVFVVLLGVAGLLWLGLARVRIDPDIFNVLPMDDPVLQNAGYVFKHHPGLQKVAIDISLANHTRDRDALVNAARVLARQLKGSGLFLRVGNGAYAAAFPRLLQDITDHLPVLLTRSDLDKALGRHPIARRVDQAIREIRDRLAVLGGIGRVKLDIADPLGLRSLVLTKMSYLLPAASVVMYRGQIFTRDGRHLLLVAVPRATDTNSTFAHRLDATIRRSIAAMREKVAKGRLIRAVPVGGYRAAIDNEDTARRDSTRAVILSGILILLLLILFFPRPWLGLLALAPAVAGTAAGLVLYSFVEPSISLLALAFGGAIISITVDYGIGYLLFLDSRTGATGKSASHNLWSVSLLAALTTVAAFLALLWSDFPVLGQLGLFAALGVACSFLFVHTAFPWMFVSLAPGRGRRWVDMEQLTAGLVKKAGWVGFGVAVALFVFLGFFARPHLHTDLNAINSLSPQTRAAERMVKKVWGNVMGRVFVLVQGRDIIRLQDRSDGLAALIDRETADGILSGGFSLSYLYPGKARARKNLAAWRSFWTDSRTKTLRRAIATASAKYGFTADAFAPFLRMVEHPSLGLAEPPEAVYALLGIARKHREKGLVATATIRPGPRFDDTRFFQSIQSLGGVKVLDSRMFQARMGKILGKAFVRMIAMVGIGIVVLLFFAFLGILLPALVLTPIVFSMVCTVGTLNLLGRPLGIPGLLLAAVVIGVGVDYAIFFVRSYQRYRDEDTPLFGPIRNAVLLDSLSTMSGFGALALSGNLMLQNVGLIGFLAITYAAAGTFFLLPPLLRRVFIKGPEKHFKTVPSDLAGSAVHRRLTMQRYRLMEAYPRQFARFKMLLDPMFPRLAEFVRPNDRVFDIGCGYGVPGAWLLTLYPDIRLAGIDPDQERVRVANLAWGRQGQAWVGAAPQLPEKPKEIDLAMMLDMVHHLSDDGLRTVLNELSRRLAPDGRLLMRVIVPTGKKVAWEQALEVIRFKLLGIGRPFYRDIDMLRRTFEAAGFRVDLMEPTAQKREETWILARLNAGG